MPGDDDAIDIARSFAHSHKYRTDSQAKEILRLVQEVAALKAMQDPLLERLAAAEQVFRAAEKVCHDYLVGGGLTSETLDVLCVQVDHYQNRLKEVRGD